MRAIKRSLGSDLKDAEQALLACLKFQHLNAEAPKRHSVIIKDWAFRLSQADATGFCSQTKAVTYDVYDIQKTLQAKINWQTKDQQSAMIKLLTQAENAIMQLHAMLAGAV